MKRRALLLNHADGLLASDKDVQDMIKFLRSNSGGAWRDDEIVSKRNIALAELNTFVSQLQEDEIDYLLFYFSGHGGYERGTVIELNPRGETISERAVSKLVPRQLNIYDCCRQPPEPEPRSFAAELLKESQDGMSMMVRKIYEKRIMEARPQQMSLYACSVGECAYDLGRGGVYTQNLLGATRSFEGDFLLAMQAHIAARPLTIEEVAARGENQHPDCFVAKLPQCYQLPFALNLNLN